MFRITDNQEIHFKPLTTEPSPLLIPLSGKPCKNSAFSLPGEQRTAKGVGTMSRAPLGSKAGRQEGGTVSAGTGHRLIQMFTSHLKTIF